MMVDSCDISRWKRLSQKLKSSNFYTNKNNNYLCLQRKDWEWMKEKNKASISFTRPDEHKKDIGPTYTEI